MTVVRVDPLFLISVEAYTLNWDLSPDWDPSSCNIGCIMSNFGTPEVSYCGVTVRGGSRKVGEKFWHVGREFLLSSCCSLIRHALFPQGNWESK
mmetsp:Transcript_5183/g.8467  ORF Transcript_5183/g.8467 Transcript_5183/m.8467 type:complete len:94 (+) Transcript_5183:757-1038(+)